MTENTVVKPLGVKILVKLLAGKAVNASTIHSWAPTHQLKTIVLYVILNR